MNFKRIQWIFLLAFLVFDLVVGGSLLWGNRFTTATSQLNRQSTVLREMHNDAISYGSLSNRQQTGYYIAGKRSGDSGKLEEATSSLHDQDFRMASGTLTSEFDTPIKVNKQNPSKRINRLLKNKRMVALGSNYRYSKYLSDKNTVVYTQIVEGRPLESTDGQLRFHLNNGREVIGYTQTYLQDAEVLRPRTSTISQQRAVTWLYKHNQLPNNSRIQWAVLGYTKLLSTTTDDKGVYVPTWIVEIKTKNSGTVQQLRVNAFNSTVMKETPDSVNTDSLNK